MKKIDSNIEQIDSMEKYMESSSVKLGKEELQKLLQNMKAGTDFSGTAESIIYKMLTQRSEFTAQTDDVGKEAVDIYNQFKDQADWYRSTLDAVAAKVDSTQEYKWEGNPAWSGINTRPEEASREGNNLKVYTTIPLKEYTFVKDIFVLAKKMRELALESDDIIKVKVPGGLTGFLAHNDSVVVHFKNKDNIEKIKNIIDEWMEQSNLHEGERELGRTRVAADPKKTSFSQLVSQNIANWLVNNFGSYDTDVLVEEGVKHAILQSQKAPF